MKNFGRRHLLKNTTGASAIIFSVAAAAAFVIAGAAIEVSRVNDVKSKLNSIADAAALAGKKKEAETHAAQATARAAGEAAARQSFDANKAQLNGLATNPTLTLSWDTDNSLRATVNARATMVLGGVFALFNGGTSVSFIDARGIGVATAGTEQYVEIALVLDNTGSMFSKDGRPESRFTLLRQAARSFVNSSFDNMTTPNRLRMAVIPYAATVNIKGEDPLGWDRSAGSTAIVPDYGSRSVIASPLNRNGVIQQNPAALASEFAPVGWRGCISGAGESQVADDDIAGGFKWYALSAQPNNYMRQWVPYRYVSQTCTYCPPPPPGPPPPPVSPPPTSPPPPPTSPPPPPPPPTGMDGNLLPKGIAKNRMAGFTVPMDKLSVKKVTSGCYPYDCSSDRCDWSVPSDIAPWTVYCNGMDTMKYYGADPYTRGRRNTYHQTAQQCLDTSCSPPPGPPYQTSQPCVADPNEIAWNSGGGRWCPWVAATTWTQFDPTTGPNLNCPMPMLGLSGSRPQILETIDRMSPVVGGTHGDVGLRWGLRALSPRNYWANFFGNGANVPRNYGRTNARKAVVFITDGNNTQSNDFPGYWGCSDTNAPGCTGSPDRTILDNRMLDWCTAMRNMEIDVYTVAVNISDTTAVSLLATCAGTPENAFAVDAAQLNATLSTIASSIFKLHLKE